MIKKIALEGKINGCSDSQCKDWREQVINQLILMYSFHNPMDFDCRGKEKELERELVSFDEKGIYSSDYVLVMAEEPSWGTAMAIQIAYSARKTIVSVCSKENPSPWLKNRSNFIVKTLEEAMVLLKRLYVLEKRLEKENE